MWQGKCGNFGFASAVVIWQISLPIAWYGSVCSNVLHVNPSKWTPSTPRFLKLSYGGTQENIHIGAMAEAKHTHWKKNRQNHQQNIITFYHFPCSCLNSLRPLHLGLHTWFLLPIRFGAGDLEGDLTFWEFPPFSAIFPTFITADIMASMEDKSAPSKLFGELGDTL